MFGIVIVREIIQNMADSVVGNLEDGYTLLKNIVVDA